MNMERIIIIMPYDTKRILEKIRSLIGEEKYKRYLLLLEYFLRGMIPKTTLCTEVKDIFPKNISNMVIRVFA
jgi:hypothetical protein